MWWKSFLVTTYFIVAICFAQDPTTTTTTSETSSSSNSYEASSSSEESSTEEYSRTDDCGGSQPLCPGDHQVFNPCPPICPTRTCANVITIPFCPATEPGQCGEPGCTCVTPFFMNANNECVTKDVCLKCKRPNEYFDCGSACDNVCASISTQNKTDCPIKNKKCNPMCYCADGYARDANADCIAIKDCPPVCPKNEEYKCKVACPVENCVFGRIGIVCLPPAKQAPCKSKCWCVDGYRRAGNGTCIPAADCPKIGPPVNKCPNENEVFNPCPSSCPPGICDSLYRKYKCVPPPKPGSPDCKASCVCKDGYYRDDNGHCVSEQQCRLNKCEKTCTGKNQVCNCKPTCGPGTCESIGAIYGCPNQPVVNASTCQPTCKCQDGFYKDGEGNCISVADCQVYICEKCTGKNEVCRCKSCSPGTCDSIGNSYVCPPGHSSDDSTCQHACECIDGYCRDNNGDCVSEEDCKRDLCAKNCTDKNEECKCKIGCSPGTCESIGKSYSCPAEPVFNSSTCQPTCQCKDGYYYDDKGNCISEEECKADVCASCDGPDEVCTCLQCSPDTCESLGKNYNCPANLDQNFTTCTHVCNCRDGLYRDDYGICVSEATCRLEKCEKNCTGKNQVCNCKPTCGPGTCESIGDVYACPLQPVVNASTCQPTCKCQDGFYKDGDGNCISVADCQVYICEKCTGKNEVCRCKSCSPGTCDSIGQSYVCPPGHSSNDSTCQHACECIDGYYRDNNGDCVSEEVCKQEICAKNCTGKNEECKCKIGCSPGTCDSIGKVYHCPLEPVLDNSTCTPTCQCKDGYYRDASGNCVTKEECECGSDEHFEECPSFCPGESCASLEYRDRIRCAAPPQPGDPDCKPSCRCNKDLMRDDNGICVSIAQCEADNCAKKCTGDNEECSCPARCPPDYCDNIGKIFPCPFQPATPNPNCSPPTCQCKPGFWRNANGDCVTPDECKSCNPPPTQPPSVNSSLALQQFYEGANNYEAEFSSEVAAALPLQNVISSAYSTETPLCQLVIGSEDGDSKTQILSALGIPNQDTLITAFPLVNADLASVPGVQILQGSALYVSQKFTLNATFESESKKLFNSTVASIDFTDSQTAANIINAWVDGATNHLISTLVTADDFDASTRLVLVNAIYFKGEWDKAFNVNNTKPRDFHPNSNTTKQIPIMYQEDTFNYTQSADLNCSILRMFYKDQGASLDIFLPNDIDGVDALQEAMKDTALVQKALSQLSARKIKIYIPKFTITSVVNLLDIWKKLGITKITTADSGLTQIVNTKEKLSVDKGFHKATIEVSETGTVAAAASAVGIHATAVLVSPPPPIFNVDHPCIFQLGTRTPQLKLFTGLYRG